MIKFCYFCRTAAVLLLLSCNGQGCSRALREQPKPKTGAIEEDTLQPALDRALRRLSEVEWLAFANRRYDLRTLREGNGDYTFTFIFTDMPDATVVARVSPTNVTLSGRWVQPP